MKLAKIITLAAALALFVLACSSASNTNQTANTGAQPTPAASAQPSPADEMTAVRAIYAAECARCHGANGDGGNVTVMKKKLKVPSLKVGHALDHTEAQLTKQIEDGGDGMPAYKDRLKPDEIKGLVRLIRQDMQGGKGKK